MKKGRFLLVAACISGSAYAQHSGNNLSHWCVDVNLNGGMLQQKLTTVDLKAAYPGVVNSKISGIDSKGKNSMSGDLQVGYFFGPKRHWGISTGFLYQRQQADVSIAEYHVEYRSLDYKMDTFRQLITAKGPLKENVRSTSVSIPIMLKYQTQLSHKWGFMADAGVLINLINTSSYTTNATYDYEAVYKFDKVNDINKPVYDNGAAPGVNTWLITQAEYQNDMEKFNTLQAQGYNIGLAVRPESNTGSMSYKEGAVGFVVQPVVSYSLSDMVILKFGVYYMKQMYSNDALVTYKTTNGVGEYNSMLNGVTKSENSAAGINLGARVFVGKVKDIDHDGIADKRDLCPEIAGLRHFNGCPDVDGDSIIDAEDHCPKVAGVRSLHGCPDSDGDGIADKDDACPARKGDIVFFGCPDTDGDGIADRHDACPEEKGSIVLRGCPDTDGDGLVDKEDKCLAEAGPIDNGGCPVKEAPKPATPEPTIDITTPILFAKNTYTIKGAYPQLDEAARIYRNTPGAYIQINGYTDSYGSIQHNSMLSRKRANAVKNYLVNIGVDPVQIKIQNYGSKDPITTNRTREGRAQNRRVMVNVVLGTAK